MAESTIKDGSVDFLGGQDASIGRSPNHLAENTYAAGINVTTQMAPRWAMHQCPLTFTDETFTLRNRQERLYSDIYYSGKFQAQIKYSVGREFYQVYIVSGVIYFINQRDFSVSIITIEDGSRLNEYAPRINWTPAGKYLVLFDWPAYPVIIEGTSARRADPSKFEIPISVLGAYNQNRVFIGNAGNEFTGGDPAGTFFEPITFNQVIQPSTGFTGQIFQLTTNYANDTITAMGFLQTVDTSTGIGPLLVSTQNEIYSYQTQLERSEWQAGKFGASFVAGVGIVGARAFDNVGSDIFFVSGTGKVHTTNMSREQQASWSKTPISGEVANWLKYFDSDLLSYSIVTAFENRIFITANPYRTMVYDTNRLPVVDIAFGGLAVLDAANFAVLGRTSPPVWDGLWTGVRPMDLSVNDSRCFIAAKDENFGNSLYELVPSSTLDMVRGRERYVKSRVYTRSYDFKNPIQLKQLKSLMFNLENIRGDFTLEVEFKPAHSPVFLPWRTFTHAVPWRKCRIDSLEDSACPLAGQSFLNFNLGSPESTECNPATLEMYTTVNRVQLRFTLSAVTWSISEVVINAIPNITDTENITSQVCTALPQVELYGECCNTDWVIPEISECQSTLT